MNKELKEKWVAALRSGKYHQAKRCLNHLDMFCCLGVACDISGLGQWSSSEYFVEGESKSSGWLSHEMRERYGLSAGDSMALAVLNDDGKTFLQIADHIEQNL